MSPATCKSSIALGLVGVMVLGVGCATTRLGSPPKMNLAWWKKDDAAPGTRHDDLAPPSTTLTPTASVAVTKPVALTPSTTSQPSRTPYQVDDAVRVSEGPPTSRSFELSKQPAVSTPPAGDDAVPVQRKSFGLPSTSPVAGTSTSAPSGIKGLTIPPRPAEGAAKFDDLTNVPRSNSTGLGSSSMETQMPTQTAQTATPIRVMNPFAADPSASAPTPQRVPLPTNIVDTKASIATEAPAAGSVYTRTPYNSFAPKATAALTQASATTPVATKPPTNMSPLQPMIPKVVPEGTSISPTSSSPTVQVPDGGKLVIGGLPQKSSSMPDALLTTQGSYAPGSVRGAQSSNLILPNSAPATTPSTIAPKPILPATQTIVPSSSSTPALGGGGSFNLSK